MKCYVVDAFTDTVFKGNPAAVCVLEEWPSQDLMQQIAIENNLSETAFAVPDGQGYGLRWFTPGGEIDLCGHATLATAFVITQFIEPDAQSLVFSTRSGQLSVTRKQDFYEMELPAYDLKQVPVTEAMVQAIGFRPVEAWIGRDLVCVLDSAAMVKAAKPDLEKTRELDGLLLHLTARGTDHDCVTRSFAPKLQVAEDPVCGSGHCHVFPLWSRKLQKKRLQGLQASSRSGLLLGRVAGSRVFIAGQAALYSISELLPAV